MKKLMSVITVLLLFVSLVSGSMVAIEVSAYSKMSEDLQATLSAMDATDTTLALW